MTILAFATVFAVAGCESPEERMRSHHERAVELLNKGEHVKAGLEFRNALKINEDFVPALRGLATVEERKANWRVVAGVLQRIIDLEPKDVESRVKLGKLLLLSGHASAALKFSNEAHKIIEVSGSAFGPVVRADVLALRATVLYRLGDTEGAVKTANATLKANPENIDALVVLAAERVAAKDSKAALAHLNTALTKNEKNIGLQIFKIQLLASMKDNEQVEAVFKKLRGLYPKNQAIALALARFYLKRDRKDEAEKELRAAATANPDDANPVFTLVRFLLETKGFDAARDELAARIAKGGEVLQFQLALARLHSSQDQRPEAERILNGIIAEDETSAGALRSRIELAKIMLATNRRDKAEALVDKILSKDARNVEGLILRASLLVAEKSFDDAVHSLRVALNEQPRSARIQTLLGRAHEYNGAIELADEQFAVAAKTSRYNPRVAGQCAQFLLRHGRLERAETVLTEILQRQPRNRVVLRTLADVRLRRQNWIGAQEIAETLRKLGDDDDEGLSDQIKAAALAGQKKLVESIQILEGVFADGKYPVQPMVALFNTYLRAGQEAEAQALARNAIAANPKNAQAHVLLGTLHLRKGRRDEAKADFRRAIEVRPDAIVGYRALAGWHFRGGDYEAANRVLHNALETRSEDVVLRLTLAGLLERQGKHDEAIAEYETMLEARPLAPVLANNLASLLADFRTDEASLERAYTLAKRLQSSSQPHFKDTLGWVYHRRGQHEAAAVLLKEARDGLPNVPLVRYHLGMTYRALRQNELAKEELTKALELAEKGRFDQRDTTEKALKELEAVATQ